MLNGYDLFIILFLVILLLICFFIMGYLYARIRFIRYFERYLKTNQAIMQNHFKKPRNIEIKEIKIDSKEDFEKMMKNLFDETMDDEENGDDDNDIRKSS